MKYIPLLTIPSTIVTIRYSYFPKENLKRDSSKRESHNGFSYFDQQESQKNRSSSNCNTHQSNAPMYMERVGDSESQSSIVSQMK